MRSVETSMSSSFAVHQSQASVFNVSQFHFDGRPRPTALDLHSRFDRINRTRTSGGRSEFEQDVDIQDAVLWRLETLAEATGKLSEELKLRHPELRCNAISGFRNVVATLALTLAGCRRSSAFT